jgi:hypothetical protein
VTDLLRVELEAAQIPSLVEQLAVTRRDYEGELARDEARWEAIPEWQRESRPASVLEAAKDLDASRFDLRAVDVIRAQLGAGGEDSSATTIVGPSRIVAELARDTAQRVAVTLNELLEERPRGNADSRARLLQGARGGEGVGGDVRRVRGGRVVQVRD